MLPNDYDPDTYKYYNINAASYCSDKKDLLTQTAHRVLNVLRNTESLLLDYGCGCGHDLHFFMKNGLQCYGYEPIPGLLSEAEKYYPDLKGRVTDNPGKPGFIRCNPLQCCIAPYS